LAYTVQNRKVTFYDLGLIAYPEALDFQTKLFQETINVKTAERQNVSTSPWQNINTPPSQDTSTKNHLIFCEHPHVFTLGKSGDESNLLVAKENLGSINATYVPINRGGDITYHGPGQLVVYPIFDLDNFFTDIHKFMRALEEAVVNMLQEFGIEAGQIEKLTGVWLDTSHPAKARKICAMGVKMSRWVTMHGLALNVNPDLNYFNYIVPCGIQDKAVTSMEKELNTKIDMNRVKSVLKEKLADAFGAEIL
jgi:lipoyl(octanoyl) transferase